MVQCDPVVTIDLSNFATRKTDITKQLMAAASDIGFFRVKGLHMPLSCTALPVLSKLQCKLYSTCA